MKKIEKAILKKDPNIRELADIISDFIEKYYGEHNYEKFKETINERLKTYESN